MRALTQPEIRDAREAFERVFSSGNPYGEPFQPDIEARCLVFETGPYMLDEDQFHALAKAARQLGEDDAYLSDVGSWWEGLDWETPIRDHWLLSLEDWGAYDSPPREANFVLIPNAVYSVSGRWGILISDEQHGLVGGPRQFVDSFLESIPDSPESMLRNLIEYWRDQEQRFKEMSAAWIPPQVRHLYGEAEGERLLEACGW